MLSSCVSLKLTFLSDKFCIVLLIALCTGTNVNVYGREKKWKCTSQEIEKHRLWNN